MKTNYTVSDCIVLGKCLSVYRTHVYSRLDMQVNFDLYVLNSLKRSLQETPNVGKIVMTKLSFWIKLAFDEPVKNKVKQIVFKVPLEEVPLWVNVPEVEPFVRWRLSIAK